MRCPSFVIACGLLFAGGTNLLLAQHSGGHASNGGHSASSGHSISGHSGFASSSHFNTGSYNSGQLTYPTSIGLQQTYSGYTGINRGALSTVPYGIGRGGYGRPGRGGYRGGYFAYPYYYSGYDDYTEPYTYNAYPEQDSSAGATYALGDQVAQLAVQVDALRAERESGQEGQSVPSSYNAAATAPADPPSPPLVLVLKGGKQVQVKSYAVMGSDIWDFSAQPAKRIPVSGLDLNASRSATEAAGGDFPEIRTGS